MKTSICHSVLHRLMLSSIKSVCSAARAIAEMEKWDSTIWVILVSWIQVCNVSVTHSSLRSSSWKIDSHSLISSNKRIRSARKDAWSWHMPNLLMRCGTWTLMQLRHRCLKEFLVSMQRNSKALASTIVTNASHRYWTSWVRTYIAKARSHTLKWTRSQTSKKMRLPTKHGTSISCAMSR